MTSFDLDQAFAAITDHERPSMLGAFAADTPCMLGVAAFSAGSREGLWERHDRGDELLVLLRGRMTFTLVHADGTTTKHDLGAGQAICIPRGAAHTATIVESIHVLFVTPRDGNASWPAA